MHKRIHVRGQLAPSNPNLYKAANADKIRDGLGASNLFRIMSNAEVSDKGVIDFNYSYASFGPNISDVKRCLTKFIHLKEVKELNLYGKLTFVMETDDDFPKLYKLIVENGQITTKVASMVWEDQR